MPLPAPIDKALSELEDELQTATRESVRLRTQLREAKEEDKPALNASLAQCQERLASLARRKDELLSRRITTSNSQRKTTSRNVMKTSAFAFARTRQDPTEDMTYERFRRICGLYDTIAPAERRPPELVSEFNMLREKIEAMFADNLDPEEAADWVHNLNLLFVRLAPLPMLRSFMHANREDFQEAIGNTGFQRYLTSEGYRLLADQSLSSETREAYVRGDAIYVVNETRRQVLAQRHVEAVRANLILTLQRGWLLVALPLIVVVVATLCLKAIGDHYAGSDERQAAKKDPAESTAAPATALPPAPAPGAAPSDAAMAPAKPSTATPTPKPVSRPVLASVADFLVGTDHDSGSRFYATPLQKALYGIGVLSLAALAGAIGSFVSVLMRIASVTDSSQLGRNIVQFKNSRTVVQMAPTSGAIFGVVISGLFAAGLVSGSVFPKLPDDYPWFWAWYYHSELAKWCIWAFLAGFSERLVPDMLDRITTRAQADEQRNPVVPNAPLPVNGVADRGEQARPAPAPPAAPKGIKLAKTAAGVEAVWAAAPDATDYLPWVKVSARGSDFVALPGTTNTSAVIDNLPSTGTLQFCVQARNGAGDSPKSEVAEVALG